MASSYGLTQPSAMRWRCRSNRPFNSECSSSVGGRDKTSETRTGSGIHQRIRPRRASWRRALSAFHRQRFVEGHKRLQRVLERVRRTQKSPRWAHRTRQETGTGPIGSGRCRCRDDTGLRPLLRSMFRAVGRRRLEQERRSGRLDAGSPISGFRSPLAERAMSRTTSPSTRNRGPRDSRRLYRSRS